MFLFLCFVFFFWVGLIPLAHSIMCRCVYVFVIDVVSALNDCSWYFCVVSLLYLSLFSYLMDPLPWLLTSALPALYVLVMYGDEFVRLRFISGRSWHCTVMPSPSRASISLQPGNAPPRMVWVVLCYWVHPPILLHSCCFPVPFCKG